MGNRITKIYTKTGDSGSTGLGDGSRTLKCSDRINAIGTVDELNSSIGLLLTESLPEQVRDFLNSVQHELFDIGSELSVPGYRVINDSHITRIEEALDKINEELTPLKEFILPGGSRGAALAHQARTICRRAERSLIQLEQVEKVEEPIKKYLNRLSDYLFVACREINKFAGVTDVYWKNNRSN